MAFARQALSFCDEHGLKWAPVRVLDVPLKPHGRAVVLNVVSLYNPWHALHWLVPGAAWLAQLGVPEVRRRSECSCECALERSLPTPQGLPNNPNGHVRRTSIAQDDLQAQGSY